MTDHNPGNKIQGIPKMKILLSTVAAILLATSSFADTPLGSNLTFGGELKAERKVDADTSIVTIKPELEWTPLEKTEFTFGTTLSVWDNTNHMMIDDELDHLPVIDFGAEYQVRDDFSIEAKTSYDLEAEGRGEITFSATFDF